MLVRLIYTYRIKINFMKKLDTISSAQNNHLKLLKKLALKKYRQEQGRFVVENLTIIKDALTAGFNFEALFVTPDFVTRNIDKFQFLHENSDAPYYLVEENLNRHYSQLETPSGIAALYQLPKNNEISNDSVIYLNAISDPGNLGTILRTALAFNFKNIILDANCVDVFNAKTISAAKDSIFKLNILKDEDGSWIKNCQLPIYITSSHGESNLDDFKAAIKFCLVLGNESHGTSEVINKMAVKKIKIDISDKIESLNVGVAAGILLYKLKK